MVSLADPCLVLPEDGRDTEGNREAVKMRFKVTNIAKGTEQLFVDKKQADEAFDALFVPRYKALVKKLGHQPNARERKAIQKTLTTKIVSYEFDFSDDIDENGDLLPEARERYQKILEEEMQKA